MKFSKAALCSIFVLVPLIGIRTASAGGPSKVVAPDQRFFGKSYGELASEWSNWLSAEPFATNPAFDPDGRFCDLNQQGKVWFLTGTFAGVADRTCAIPAGKALFFSLGGSFVSFAPEFPDAGNPCLGFGSTLEQVRCDVNDDVTQAPAVAYEVVVDGVPVKDLFAYRAQSVPGGFTLRVPDPSFLTDLGLPAGDRFPAVADGYFLFLKPLKPGVHTLSLIATNADGSQTGARYTLLIGGHDVEAGE